MVGEVDDAVAAASVVESGKSYGSDGCGVDVGDSAGGYGNV